MMQTYVYNIVCNVLYICTTYEKKNIKKTPLTLIAYILKIKTQNTYNVAL